jgi:hypothetical protein
MPGQVTSSTALYGIEGASALQRNGPTYGQHSHTPPGRTLSGGSGMPVAHNSNVQLYVAVPSTAASYGSGQSSVDGSASSGYPTRTNSGSETTRPASLGYDPGRGGGASAGGYATVAAPAPAHATAHISDHHVEWVSGSGDARVGGAASVGDAVVAIARNTNDGGAGVSRRRGGNGGGGEGDEVLVGESPRSRWSWWWALVIIVLLAMVGLIIWWIVVITMPKRPKDITARDICARDLALSHDLTISGVANLAGDTRLASAAATVLSTPPVAMDGLNIVLQGTETCISLTNQSGSIVTVTLPSSAEFPGLFQIILNESANSEFRIQPQGNETIEGSPATLVEVTSVLLIANGVAPSGVGDWKQLI